MLSHTVGQSFVVEWGITLLNGLFLSNLPEYTKSIFLGYIIIADSMGLTSTTVT